MSLTFKHFDTRLNQWLHTDGNKNNPESILKEELNNTLLQFFLQDKRFSFGQMDEHSTADDLKNHPDDHVLLFSSKSRLLYGPPECLEVVEKLCPDRKDRGAYGSIFLGACKNGINEKLNILVVDDTTGENGGILNNEDAWKLVGDCYGQISTPVYERLTQRESNSEEPYRVVQHRFGWREGDGQDNAFRFGKGTLRPCNLNKIEYANPNNKPSIDLILPLSSFKGTDKDNPASPTKPQIQPGLYNQTIWLGEKSQSQQAKTAISQLLASFPQGIKDFAEEVEAQAKKLAQIQNDPRQVAQLYCEKYEQRREQQQDESSEAQAGEGKESERDDLFMYKLIKADLGHCQLLETEKVKQELARFVQTQWRDIAIGRTLTFDRAMIIPSKELKNSEICVPWFNEGEKVLNFRSPFLNSNGLCVSTNKHIEDYLGPDGRPLEGIIVVNDETHSRIQARIAQLKARGIETSEVDPVETESERQGRDFDGDCIGVSLARKCPNLTAEAEYRNLPENAYAPTVKLKKQSFYREDGTQPDFEEIAIFMSDSISVGVINNQVTAFEALESEIELLRTYGTVEQRAAYLDCVTSHYKKIFSQEDSERNPKPIREKYRKRMEEIVSLASVKNRTPQMVEQAMVINRSIYRDLIEEGCFQNQIGVDMFKSARSPDMELVKENKRYLYRDVNYIKDKKLSTAYLNEGINVQGYSPVELLISQTNNYFQASQLESRPLVQFQDLFGDVEFSPQLKFAAIVAKQEFDRKFNEATRLEQRRQTEQGPYAIVRTREGTQIEITNLTRYGHPDIWQAQTLNLRFEEIPQRLRNAGRPHKLLALAQINDSEYRPLGTVSEQSAINQKFFPGTTLTGATLVEIKPELRQSQTKLLFQQAQAIAADYRATIPEAERLSAAAAAWNISTTREEKPKPEREVSESTETEESPKKISNFVFAAFPDEVLSRLDRLQFTNLKVLRSDRFPSNIENSAVQYEVEIVTSNRLEDGNLQARRAVFIKDSNGEYKEFGILEPATGSLPIGTKSFAAIVPGETYVAKATLADPGKPPIEFTIREISKFAYANTAFNGRRAVLSITTLPVPSNTVKVKLDGRVLGELDAESIRDLKKISYLSDGNNLLLKLKSIGKNAGAFIIGESPKGNLIRINKINYYDFKHETFDKNIYKKLSFEIQANKMKDAVLLDGKLLGVLHFQKDKEALKQLGILKPGREGKVTCLLQSNFSHSFVRIAPASVQYPENWTKQSVSSAPSPAMVEASEPLLQILQKLKERPTVLFSSKEDKVFGIVGLAADSSKAAIVEKWLEARAIAYKAVPPDQARLATRKGLVAFYLTNSTIAPKDWQALVARFGTPLDADGSNNAYSQYLDSLPDRPAELAPTKLATPAKAQLPTLLAREDYEWEVEPGTFVEKPTTRIAVDSSKAIALTSYFTSLGITPMQATDSYDVQIESQLGYAVFRIPDEAIHPVVRAKLQQQFGTPLDAHYNSSYYQRLTEIEQQKIADERDPAMSVENVTQQIASDRRLSPSAQNILIDKTTAERNATGAAVQNIITETCPGATTCTKPEAPATFIAALAKPTKREEITANRNGNPLKQVTPLNAAVARHAVKDIAMATRNYEQAWGDRALPEPKSDERVSPAQKLSLAIAAKNLLIHHGQSSIELKGYNIEQTGNLLTVACSDGRAEILRLHGTEFLVERLVAEDVSRFQELQKALDQKPPAASSERSQNRVEGIEIDA